MAKFTFEDKLWAVKEYEKGILSFRDIHDYIYYYSNIRIKEKLKDLSPVEYRTQVQQVA